MEPREFLSRTPPFDRLGRDLVRLAERSLEIVYVARGDAILRTSDSANAYLFVVRKGAVRLVQGGRVLQVLEEGDAFGYPSLISGGSPGADAFAEQDALLYRFPKETFDSLRAEPEFASWFLSGLASRLRTAAAGPSLLPGSLSEGVVALIVRPPLFVGPGTPVAEAAEVMSRERVSSVLVSGEPMGIVTDRDLRNRVLARRLDPAAPVRTVMTHPVRTIPAGATVFESMVVMLELRVHHLPVEEKGRVVGVVTDTDLLRHQIRSPLHLLRLIDRIGEPGELTGFVDEVGAAVDVLAQGGLDPVEIGRIVATLHDAAARRVLEVAQEALGPPPADYAWIVFGSEGRMEQGLLTDQDNALVHGGATFEQQVYFQELGARAVEGLARLGIPRCAGGFMADRWAMSLAAWERQFGAWIEEPDEHALVDAANFFDFRRVSGSLSLEPLETRMLEASRNSIFLARMARNAIEFRPPLGLFHRIREKPSGVDLKKGGIIPIVALARVYALGDGIRARGTLERLSQAAGRPDGLSTEGSEVLREAFRFLLRLRLSHQLECRRLGRPIDNAIHLDQLAPLDRRHLKEVFVEIARVQDALALRWETSLLS